MMSTKARIVGIGVGCLVILAAIVLLVQTVTEDNSLSQQKDKSAQQPQANLPKTQAKPFQFPGGGRTLFPHYRLVALYGTPGEPVLGALGQQSLPKTIERAQKLAKDYQPYSKQPMYPALEIIATVASNTATENGDYSREIDANKLLPWIQAAEKAGVYVTLDLQPGRSDFLSQAKEYQSLLAYPNVGLALDPEWRLRANQLPLVQIGSVGIKEVNATADWLATFTQQHKLPQKLFVLHQFRLDMLPNRDQLDTSHANLAYVIQMDGQGPQAAKQSTWRDITTDPPKNVNFGWKNFYQKDPNMLSPKATMAIKPQPQYISYQ